MITYTKYFSIRQATQHLFSGGVVAYPTEAVWGLGCNPWDYQAFLQLLRIKKRAMHKGVILIAGHQDLLSPFVDFSYPLDWNKVFSSWPGANTWIVPASSKAPAWITGGRDTIAVRVTQHPLVKQLTQNAKFPLVSTSANVSGQLPARNALTCRRWFGNSPNFLILNGDTLGLEQPSSITDAISEEKIR
ncbi:MAG: Sua5/YciO/YrdC/YwlC family protein [Pseudomonadota bacterium]